MHFITIYGYVKNNVLISYEYGWKFNLYGFEGIKGYFQGIICGNNFLVRRVVSM